MNLFPHGEDREGLFVGRIWSPEAKGPCVVTLRDGNVVDITSRDVPLVADIMEMADPASHVRDAEGRVVGSLEEIASNDPKDRAKPHFLSPCDMQSIKACGVTFASSMVERVIEEQAAGDPKKALDIRERIGEVIGGSLRNIKAGSEEAQKVKQALIAEGMWPVPGGRDWSGCGSVFQGAGALINGAGGRGGPSPDFTLEQSGARDRAGRFAGRADRWCDPWQ